MAEAPTAEERQQMEQIIHDYLLREPLFLIEVLKPPVSRSPLSRPPKMHASLLSWPGPIWGRARGADAFPAAEVNGCSSPQEPAARERIGVTMLSNVGIEGRAHDCRRQRSSVDDWPRFGPVRWSFTPSIMRLQL